MYALCVQFNDFMRFLSGRCLCACYTYLVEFKFLEFFHLKSVTTKFVSEGLLCGLAQGQGWEFYLLNLLQESSGYEHLDFFASSLHRFVLNKKLFYDKRLKCTDSFISSWKRTATRRKIKKWGTYKSN